MDNINLKLSELSKLIGNTPLVEISYKFKGKKFKAFAKLEWYNLSGSIKDRSALEIIKTAYNNNLLKPNQTICETTSGNMGISLCAIANFVGNKTIVCMPKTMSKERKTLLKLYGAKLVLTKNFSDAFVKAETLKNKGAFLTKQFENQSNELAQRKIGEEIYFAIKNISCFVSGVGTGGTLMGAGKYLKQTCGAKIFAIDPKEAGLLKYGVAKGEHKIQGLSDGLIPKLYQKELVDKVISISSDDAIAMAQKICKSFGVGVGISSGANFLGCVLSGLNNCATVFADDNKKYLSTDLSKNVSSSLVDSIELLSCKVVKN